MMDWISSLPDEILSHILSFLPTKQAVATTVLSKKWKSLWRSVPILDFDNSSYIDDDRGVDYPRFVQSVYAFFLTRDHHQPIQKFRLRLWSKCREDPADVTVWVKFALQSRLQHLEISLSNHRILPLPPPTISREIFSCTNLVVLKLKGVTSNPLSSAVDFPFLKTLHLQDLIFLEYECLAWLLSRCPVLEDFKAPSLYFVYHFPDGSNYLTLPVQFLHIHQIKLLNDMILHIDESTNHYVFLLFRNLTHIELTLSRNKDWLNMLEILKYCPQLQVLVINQQHSSFYETVEFEFESRDRQCPQAVPECILQQLKRCYLNDYRATEGEFRFARYIMRNGRVLQSMTICSCPDVKQRGKLKNLKKLSSCTRRSPTCKLSFK